MVPVLYDIQVCINYPTFRTYKFYRKWKTRIVLVRKIGRCIVIQNVQSIQSQVRLHHFTQRHLTVALNNFIVNIVIMYWYVKQVLEIS